jgi:hypothetical protein
MFCQTLSAASDEVTVKAYVDRTVIGLNQQFSLNVELSGERIDSAIRPQLPPMEAFSAYQGSGSSERYQIVNGKMSSSKTFIYYFYTTKTGKFTIGPVTVISGGKTYKSDPITIEIQKVAAQQPRPGGKADPSKQSTIQSSGEIFIKAYVDKQKVFQNEPVIITYKIYTQVTVSQINYSKLPSTTGFWVEDFTLPQRPQITVETLGGKRYNVAVIKKSALFPLSSGQKNIDPLIVDCYVQEKRRSRDMFDFDDFFRDSFFNRTVQKTVRSNPVHIEVMPLPEEGRPEDFNGVVGSYQIECWVDTTHVIAHEAMRLFVKIRGQGHIRTLPEPKIDFPDGFEVYPPEMSEKMDQQDRTITGSKIFEYVIVPRLIGLHKIKQIHYSIFNPLTKSFQTLKTREIPIYVAQNENGSMVSLSGQPMSGIMKLGLDFRHIKSAIPRFQKIQVSYVRNWIFWMILFLPIFCLGAAIIFQRNQDRILADVAYARSRRASRMARKHLARSKSLIQRSRQKEFYAEVGKGMMGYLGDKLNLEEAGLITENVQELLLKRGVKVETLKPFFDCLHTCDMKRFSPTGANEREMKEFFRKAEQAISLLDKELAKSRNRG